MNGPPISQLNYKLITLVRNHKIVSLKCVVMRFITHLAELSHLGKIPDILEAVTSLIRTRQAAKDSGHICLCGDVLSMKYGSKIVCTMTIRLVHCRNRFLLLLFEVFKQALDHTVPQIEQ